MFYTIVLNPKTPWGTKWGLTVLYKSDSQKVIQFENEQEHTNHKEVKRGISYKICSLIEFEFQI